MENLIVTLFAFLLGVQIKLIEQCIANQESIKSLEKRIGILEGKRNWL